MQPFQSACSGKILTVAATACLAAAVQAQPITTPAIEGHGVVAAYQGTTASFSSDLHLGGMLIFDNHATPVGTTVSPGALAADTEPIFELRGVPTGETFYTRPASRNADGGSHARIEADGTTPGTTLVSFENLSSGPYGHDDPSFSFSSTFSAPAPPAVPEPKPWALMAAGLAMAGVIARRRRDAIDRLAP